MFGGTNSYCRLPVTVTVPGLDTGGGGGGGSGGGGEATGGGGDDGVDVSPPPPPPQAARPTPAITKVSTFAIDLIKIESPKTRSCSLKPADQAE